MPTKDQLRSIEWAGKVAGAKACPACGWGWCDPGKHAPDCWLAAALATPDTLPPVAVGDYVDLDVFGLCYVPTKEAARVLSGGSDGLKAVYHRVWQRGKE